MLVLHSTAHNAAGAVQSLLNNEVSAHYVIDLDGEVYSLVDEDKRAWHAGVASWRNINTDLNSRSVGIEVCNLSLGQTPYGEKQISRLVRLCRKLIRSYHICPEMIVAHSDIAPTRKPDPGIAFPWQYLAQKGIGLWYKPQNAQKIKEASVPELLKTIGYNTDTPETTIASAYAFRRRFLPEEVEIIEDVKQLVDNVYPQNCTRLLQGEKFLNTLKAVAYAYLNASKKP